MKTSGVSVLLGAWPSTAFELGVALIIMAAGCGGDLRGRYYYPPGGRPDGGACAGSGQGAYGCACVDRPYVLAVSLALDDKGALSDLDVDLVRQDEAGVSVSANPPAKGTTGAAGYFLAKLVAVDGTVQSSFVFADPRVAWPDAGATRHGHARFTMPLTSATATLHVETWDSGVPLVDLDLRGHLQLLCIDRPCLSVCQAPDGGARGPTGPELDSGATDGSTMDGGTMDGGTMDGGQN